MLQLQSLLGIAVFLLIAWLIGGRKRVDIKFLVGGLVLQITIVVLILKVPFAHTLLSALNQLVIILSDATKAGTSFVFGYLGGGELPFAATDLGKTFILAFNALPLVIVVSALSALLFYWRVLPWIIGLFSKLLQKSMGISGALGLGAAANIFVGMIEAPLLIRPYLQQLQRSELFALMVTGMATIAGTMMVLYAGVLASIQPQAMTHILAASVMSVPAALMLSGLMMPFDGKHTSQSFELSSDAQGAMDAITRGTLDGVKLLINILAMLVVFVALVALVNFILALLPTAEAVTLQRILGYIFAPLVWLIGIPASEVLTAGSLMGIKTILNEFLAYLQLISTAHNELTQRSQTIMIYALCGFANFGSLGIMIGGIGTLVPERRAEVAQLGLLSIVAGTLSTLFTAAIVSLFI